MRLAGLSAAVVAGPFAVALVVVDGFAPRGAIVVSLADPALVEGVVEAPAAEESGADVDGVEDVAAVGDVPVGVVDVPVAVVDVPVAVGDVPVAVVDVSAALTVPIAEKPMAEAISAYARLRFNLSIMSAPPFRVERRVPPEQRDRCKEPARSK